MADTHRLIPAPPRTPTPPTPIPDEDGANKWPGDADLDFTRPKTESSSRHARPQSLRIQDPNCLSPMDDRLPNAFGSMASPMASPAFSNTGTLQSDGSMGPPLSASPGNGPFNFQTQTYSAGSISKASGGIGQRRGHRYKHSSISAQYQIFQEPPPRAPLALPASLPIPTFLEAYKSMSFEQTTRICWCLCHLLVAAYVAFSAHGSLALTALSHLIFFDALSASICVGVDVFCNFEVWKRSSIRHPFGLERAEVLAGFAMSVFLLFMGFDLVSHNLKHVLESLGSHEPHHEHNHARVSPGSVDSAALFAIGATLVSAIGLKNHARIGKAMRFAYISSLPSVLSNPSHFLTLSCSFVMLVLPLLSITFYLWLDRLLCTLIAVSMFALGVRLAIAQGRMLLMSYNPASTDVSVKAVVREIEDDGEVAAVEEARFWQVHYGLCMANLKLRVKERTMDEGGLARVKERVGKCVKERLGGGYGKGAGVKWEVTTQLTVDGNTPFA